MSTRPFRHLCPDADERDAMSDGEFWEHVGRSLSGPIDDVGHPEYASECDVAMDVAPCGVCGSITACGYDAEGRALIHAANEEED